MAVPRRRGVVICSAARVDGAVSVVEVESYWVTLSTGERLFVRWSKLQNLCEQLCQDRTAIHSYRTWWAKEREDSTELVEELIEIHSMEPQQPTPEPNDAF